MKLNTLNWTNKYASGASFTLAALVLVLLTLNSDRPKLDNLPDTNCQQTIDDRTQIKLSSLDGLRGKEGASRETVRQTLGNPYCILPRISVRFGAITEREAYQTDNRSRPIIAYENGQYLGYGVEDASQPGRWWQPKPETTARSTYREIELDRSWGIQTGDLVRDRRVVGGLGEISIEMNGQSYAPFDGEIEGNFATIVEGTIAPGGRDCAIFSSPQMPAYLLKLCGFEQRYLGAVSEGDPIGKTDSHLHVALLSYRPGEDNAPQWVYVPPSPQLIEKLVGRS